MFNFDERKRLLEHQIELEKVLVQNGSGTFLQALSDLKDHHCTYIQAPDGSILTLDFLGGLDYNLPMGRGVYFFPETFLGEWKMLVVKNDEPFE